MPFFRKHILLFLILNSTFSIINSQVTNPNGYNKFYYDNGAISSEGLMKDDKPDGYWKNYYKNGKLKTEGNRKNFLLDSIWKFYSDNGRLTKTIHYDEGKKNGFVCNYDTAQKLISREVYVNDIKHGLTKYFFPTGKIKQTLPYVNGKPDGISYEFGPDSTVIAIYEYKGGILQNSDKINRKDAEGKKQGPWKEFFDDGKAKKEIRYNDDLLDGYVKEYDTKGNLVKTEKFNFGKQILNAPELANVEIYKTYYEDGTLKYEGPYSDGYPIGTHYYYKQKYQCDSVLQKRDDSTDFFIRVYKCRNVPVPDSAVVYNEGTIIERGRLDSLRNKIGVWNEYHNTGEFRAKGLFSNGNRVGDWVFYYPSGKMEQKGKYDKKGRPQGIWQWFYENGALMRQEVYVNGKREGLMSDYTEEGKILTQGNYYDNMKEGLWVYETPIYKEIGKYTADKQDSMWRSYYMPKEKPRFEGRYLNGEPEGLHTWYYKNGKKMFYGNYAGGLKQGDWHFYDEDGYNYLTITFENDEEVKFLGVKVTPTNAESQRVYSTVVKKGSLERTDNINKKQPE